MIRIYVMLAVIAAISTIAFAGYRFVNNLVKQNAILIVNEQVLQRSVKDTQAANAALVKDISLQGQILTDTTTALQTARNSVTTLENKLAKHNIGYLAQNKPKLVEKIINKATSNIGRCFEIAAGSQLTQAEINATVTSKINSECPALANPNFKG